MIENTYKLIKQPTRQEVLSSPCMSYWLKDRLHDASKRDLLDMLRDVEVLHAVLKHEFNVSIGRG